MATQPQNLSPGYNVEETSTNASVFFNNYSSNMEVQYTNMFHVQNRLLQNLKDLQNTKTVKVNYQNEQIRYLNFINLILVVFYYIFTFIFLIFVFIGKKMGNWPLLSKILILIILPLFPFFITTFEKILWKILIFIQTLITGNVYMSQNY
jgi:hypothetical protein